MSAALVLETNNLRGQPAGRVVDDLRAVLVALRAQSRSIQSLDEIVITHDGVSPAAQAALARIAGRSLHFVEIPAKAGYYDAKNIGFEATSAEVVVFADGDCTPASGWLRAITAPFSDPRVRAVAGRTTYGSGARRRGRGLLLRPRSRAGHDAKLLREQRRVSPGDLRRAQVP